MGSKGKKGKSDTNQIIEQGVVQLAEQLGWFLGTMRSKADNLLESEAVKKQVSQIRDGAIELFDRVNKASSAARETVSKASAAARESAKSASQLVMTLPAEPAPKRVAKPAATTKGRSGGTVDAPGKKHRKAPPQQAINTRMGEKVGKKAGQKQFKVASRRGRG
jgi:hypothetical protein